MAASMDREKLFVSLIEAYRKCYVTQGGVGGVLGVRYGASQGGGGGLKRPKFALRNL